MSSLLYLVTKYPNRANSVLKRNICDPEDEPLTKVLQALKSATAAKEPGPKTAIHLNTDKDLVIPGSHSTEHS
jgi:hypothetical protein